MTKYFAVVLHEASLEALREVIAPYLHRTALDALPYFLSLSADQVGSFLSCSVVKNNKGSTTWDIRIPLNYVLAIVDIAEGRQAMGFLDFPE